MFIVDNYRPISLLPLFVKFGRVDLAPVYRDLKILGLPEMHFMEKAKFMHKYYNGKLPALFKDYFETNAIVTHSYNLRRVTPFRPILSNYSEKMMKHNGPAIWNTVPDDIKNISNIKSFSFRLKKDIIFV